ncbi:MAG: HAMP domain-containing histidine kinase [Candidatus Sericytochromatia bacterium]|nr:HAMP domain-containing histidine kinase [Candidatus Tanganyikabacteria bacterium]
MNVPVWPVAAPTVWAFLFILGGIGALAGGLAGALRVSLRALTREVELAKAKANFTAMVSHELRTPIAVLRMHAEALRDDLVVDRGKRHEFLDSMAQEALRLQRLIENLLDLGRVERGAKLYRLVPSDLAAIAHQAVAQARQAFGDAAPEIEIEAAAGLPRALADPDAAQQAIANLVHNALKYGGDPPEVGVGISHGHGRVRVAVLDRGPGIPPEQRESVFDPYVRVGQEITRTSQGLGLGLALVRAYMRGQGGTVVLKDRPGGGSVFELDFAEEK